MSPERWEQITEIYAAALELDSEKRAEFLEKACAGDTALRREVESLLAADADAGDFINKPIVKNAAPILSADVSQAHSLIGKKLGHYQIISQLGTGGMGEVYLARDTRLNRPVAVKTLPVSLSAHPNYLQRFQIEAEAAATLNHPNVATIYSVEEFNDQPFITMEYVEGKTLDAMIPPGGLDVKTFLEWFTPVADALSHAHEKGIIHRDIKPSNIMITSEGVPKILDFGLAQIACESVSDNVSTLKMTYPGQIMGTPAYMSPEQAEGREVDSRTDIFSFGVVMYEAITGQRPFTGDSYASIVSNLLKSEPPNISEIKPETPYLLVRLINRCLNKSRRHRFQTMREIRVLLEEIRAVVEAGVSLDSFARRILPKQTEKPWRIWAFPALAFFVIALSVAAFYYFRMPATEPPLSFENITLRKLSQTNNVVYAHISPDGKSVAYNMIEENEMRSLWIRRVTDKNALQLLPPQPVFFWGGMTISRDGSQIFYITANRNAPHGTLYRISSLGGAPRKLVETVNDLGSLSPDGSRVLYVRYGERIQLLSANSADGSDERLIYTGAPNQIFRDPHYSLDGESIYFIRFENINGKEFWSLVEISADGGDERVILPPREPRISEIAVLKDGSGLLLNATDAVSNLPQLYHLDPATGEEKRLTNDLNSYFGISVSDDCRTIVSAQRHFMRDIWVTPDDSTGNFRRLTNESNVYSSAVWTPDGRIVYDAVDNNRPHIWIINGDGSSPQQLTPNDSSDFEPRVSHDGRYIVFTSDRTGEQKVWRMNIDGSNLQMLTPVSGSAGAPLITPDGESVYFQWIKEGGKVLGKVPITGGEITEQPLFSDYLSAVAPDGRQVAYSFYDQAEKVYKVGIRPLDAGAPPSVIFNISPLSFLAWTADGKGLIYRELETTRADSSTIMFQPIAGGEPKPFLSVAPDAVYFASPAPDNKKIAVVRGKLLTDAVMLTAVKPD